MKLYIKQKVFTFRDKFTVKDEFGNDRYFAKGDFFSFGKNLRIYDMHEREVICIKQKLWSFLPRFYVFVEGQKVAEVVKEFTFLKPRYRIDGPGWDVFGDWWQHQYEITQGDRLVVSVQKEWMTWGDSYCVDIRDPRDEQMALAVVLAIDCAMAAGENSVSVSLST